MKVFNQLNIDIDAYIKVDSGNRRGAGRPGGDGKHKSRVSKEDGELKIYFEDLPASKLILYLVMSQIPSKGPQKGVKVIAGERSGVPHHFTFLEKDDRYEAIVHYDLSGKSDKEKDDFITHEDPTVEHPPPGG
jgi:hypothetical protein